MLTPTYDADTVRNERTADPSLRPTTLTILDISLCSRIQKRPLGLDRDYSPTRDHPHWPRKGLEQDSPITASLMGVPAALRSTPRTHW
jgi:hypothetical protein